MLKNYFKTAIRTFTRNRQFSLINLSGLSIGICIFLFITEFVAFEWNVNRFNKNYGTLYRVNIQNSNGKIDYLVPPGLAKLAKDRLPSIENYVRVADGIGSGVISEVGNGNSSNKVFRESNILYADGNFLDIFSFPVIAGTNLFSAPNTLALSEALSIKLFGTTDVIERQISISNQFGNTVYTVKAVYQLPEESDIKGDMLLSLQTLELAANRDGNDWADPEGILSGYSSIYLQLKKNTNPAAVGKGITSLFHSANPAAKTENVMLQPFSELHLAPHFTYPFQTFGNLSLVVFFEGIALLILFIAWINYVNLSTAQGLKRAKEVGVRKVLGANRPQLIFQYLTETFILTIVAVILALLMVNLFQPTINNFTGKRLSLSALNNGWFWGAGLLLITIGSLGAGVFVAFALTSFKPVAALHGKIKMAATGILLRKSLVVFQFTISIALIIATVVLLKQFQFMSTENLGMTLNKLIVIKGPSVTAKGQSDRNAAFKDGLAALPYVEKYAASNDVPGVGYNYSRDGITKLEAPQKGDDKKNYFIFISDGNFFDTYGIHFVQGKTFSAEDVQHVNKNVKNIIVNEKAAQSLGFNLKDNIIGQKISWDKPCEIIGVVSDYHHLSLHESIRPTIYVASPSSGYYTIQTSADNLHKKISDIHTMYNKIFPGNPFEYFFADQKFNQQYVDDKQLGKALIAASSITILIACLGLFGLAAFTARQRVKEIGIRKVLGASIFNITELLVKDFTILVVISIFIASPLAWWSMDKWLQNFAYRTDINWWIFTISGAVALLIALITISFQAIKAALANPVKSLRIE